MSKTASSIRPFGQMKSATGASILVLLTELRHCARMHNLAPHFPTFALFYSNPNAEFKGKK